MGVLNGVRYPGFNPPSFPKKPCADANNVGNLRMAGYEGIFSVDHTVFLESRISVWLTSCQTGQGGGSITTY